MYIPVWYGGVVGGKDAGAFGKDADIPVHGVEHEGGALLFDELQRRRLRERTRLIALVYTPEQDTRTGLPTPKLHINKVSLYCTFHAYSCICTA